MKLRAFVLCDDIRMELGGQVTAVGIYGERITVGPGEGDIVLPRLSLYAVVSGLVGASQVLYRLRMVPAAMQDMTSDTPMNQDAHLPDNDEHNFVFVQVPAVFEQEGRFTAILEVEAAGEQLAYRYTFSIERAHPPSPGV